MENKAENVENGMGMLGISMGMQMIWKLDKCKESEC